MSDDCERQAATALAAVLSVLDLPKILPDEPLPKRVREMLFEGDGVSLRRGTMFYRENGEPIELPSADAMAMITDISAKEGREISTNLHTRGGTAVEVSTAYLGIDLSTFGPLPLVWQTVVVVGELPLMLDPWRYATLAAAHAGHSRIAELIRTTLGTGDE